MVNNCLSSCLTSKANLLIFWCRLKQLITTIIFIGQGHLFEEQKRDDWLLFQKGVSYQTFQDAAQVASLPTDKVPDTTYQDSWLDALLPNNAKINNWMILSNQPGEQWSLDNRQAFYVFFLKLATVNMCNNHLGRAQHQPGTSAMAPLDNAEDSKSQYKA